MLQRILIQLNLIRSAIYFSKSQFYGGFRQFSTSATCPPISP
jgi:hypothetical protein